VGEAFLCRLPSLEEGEEGVVEEHEHSDSITIITLEEVVGASFREVPTGSQWEPTMVLCP
jgi:hypothetical protein